MATEETLEAVRHVLNDIENAFREHYDDNYMLVNTERDNHLGLYAEDFILTFDKTKPDAIFQITFAVHRHGGIIATIMTYILTYILPIELEILSDHFFDQKNEKLYYGQEAIDASNNAILESRGHHKCPLCEKVFEKEYIGELGYCYMCEEIRETVSWN